MSRVVLDLPPGVLLALAAFVPLSTLVLVQVTQAALRLVPAGSNPLAAPVGPSEDELPNAPWRRGWKHWVLGAIGAVHVGVWGALSIYSLWSGEGRECKTAAALGLVSLGWVCGRRGR